MYNKAGEQEKAMARKAEKRSAGMKALVVPGGVPQLELIQQLKYR